MRFGLPHERADTVIMDVTLRSASQDAPDPSAFSMPGQPPPDVVPLTDAHRRLGYVPIAPDDTGHLDLTSLVALTGDAPAAPSSVLVYTAGLDYLRMSEDPAWAGPGPFGPVDAAAQPVAIPGGGVALYEPAGDGLGRRLAIHGADTDLFLETNLTRDELVSIATSLPMHAQPLPTAWRIARTGSLSIERIPIDDALGDAELSAVPTGLPPGYVIASATRTRAGGTLVGTTITFRQRETDAAGPPVTLHVTPSIDTPHTSSPDQVAVEIGTTPARWTPSDALLEWEADGGYRSLQGDVGLAVLLDIATSITAAGA